MTSIESEITVPYLPGFWLGPMATADLRTELWNFLRGILAEALGHGLTLHPAEIAVRRPEN
jgi:hypothetical protein